MKKILLALLVAGSFSGAFADNAGYRGSARIIDVYQFALDQGTRFFFVITYDKSEAPLGTSLYIVNRSDVGSLQYDQILATCVTALNSGNNVDIYSFGTLSQADNDYLTGIGFSLGAYDLVSYLSGITLDYVGSAEKTFFV